MEAAAKEQNNNDELFNLNSRPDWIIHRTKPAAKTGEYTSPQTYLLLLAAYALLGVNAILL